MQFLRPRPTFIDQRKLIEISGLEVGMAVISLFYSLLPLLVRLATMDIGWHTQK